MAPHSSTLAWKIQWMEEPGGLQSMGLLESDTTEQLHFHFSLSCIGEGNGNPLQCSCLENPRDGGAWWAAVYGVAQSRTRLKQLGSSSSSNPLNNSLTQVLRGSPFDRKRNRDSEVKSLACDYTAGTWQSQELNLHSLATETKFLRCCNIVCVCECVCVCVSV